MRDGDGTCVNSRCITGSADALNHLITTYHGHIDGSSQAKEIKHGRYTLHYGIKSSRERAVYGDFGVAARDHTQNSVGGSILAVLQQCHLSTSA